MTVKTKSKGLAFDATESQRRIDGNGFMHVTLTNISKACVNPYLGQEIPGWQEQGLEPEEIYYALRDPEELEKAAHTFNGLPLLLQHDEESADNPSEQRVGSTGTDAIFETPYLKISLSIQDQAAIDRVVNGSCKEISCAYKYTPDFTPGEFDGVAYDFVMREIEGNHVALVPEGRAGSDVVVADSKPEFLENERRKPEMSKWKRTKDQKLAKDSQEVKTMDAETIIDTHFKGANDDEKAAVNELIQLIQSGEVSLEVEKAETANDEDLEKDKEAKDSEENPDTEKEKAEDEEPDKTEDEEEKLEKEKEESLTAQDAKRIQADAEKQVIAKVRTLTQAAKDCAFLIGTHVDAMAYDSAEAIYALGVREMGLNPKDYPPAAYKGIVDAQRKQQNVFVQSQFANDAGGDDSELDDIFKNLNRIKN